MALNGLAIERFSNEDALDLAGMLITLGRAVPPEKWVDELILQAGLDTFRCLE